MSLLPAIRLDIDNAHRYESQISAASVLLGPLPRVNRARVSFPIDTALKAKTGSDATLALNDGSGWETILTGKIRGRITSLESQTAVIADGGADLAAYRPTTTFQAQEAAVVANTLAGDVDVTLDIPPGPFGMTYFAAHGNRTAAEHLGYLAALTGTLAVWTKSGNLRFMPLEPLVPTKAIKHGRDISHWHTLRTTRTPAEWVAVGHGPAGAVQAPNAMLQTTGTLPSSPSEGGAGTIRQAHAILRTPLASQTANDALNRRAELGMTQARATTIPTPSIRPGLVLEVQDLPGDHPGTWLVTEVTHRWNAQLGASTQFQAWSTASEDGLLGQLGGLL